MGPSKPNGSTMKGDSWYRRDKHSSMICEPWLGFVLERLGPRNFSNSNLLRCLKTAGVMCCEHI